MLERDFSFLYKDANFCLRCAKPLTLRKDEEGRERAICESCGFVLYRNPIPAVAILSLNEKGELLLVKRKLEPQAGWWALPSGYMEIFITPEQNAIAEMQEETGLIGEVEKDLGWYFGYSPIYFRVLSIGFRMKIVGGELKAGDDAIDARFFPLDSLPPIAFDAHKYFIQKETGTIAK